MAQLADMPVAAGSSSSSPSTGGTAREVRRAKEQRCWWHEIGNVLAAFPKSAHKDAKAALAEIYNAEDRDHAEQAAKAFAAAYGAKWPRAVAKITNDLDGLLAFYGFPGEHWVHLRTTNPIESNSQPSGYGSGSPRDPARGAAGIAMAFKLIESAHSTLACRQFRPPRRAGQSRREVRERRPRRTTRRISTR